MSFKQPSFQERTALAAKAKQAALDKLRAKPPVDEAVLAERRAAQALKDAEILRLSEEKKAAREAEKAAKKERAAEAAVAANNAPPPKTAEELKQERDARYAARKKRVGKK